MVLQRITRAVSTDRRTYLRDIYEIRERPGGPAVERAYEIDWETPLMATQGWPIRDAFQDDLIFVFRPPLTGVRRGWTARVHTRHRASNPEIIKIPAWEELITARQQLHEGLPERN